MDYRNEYQKWCTDPYFDEATKRELIQKIYDVMEPGGYFFIGQTETIDRSVTPFELIRPSIYRKLE